jgi:hypothetical protein
MKKTLVSIPAVLLLGLAVPLSAQTPAPDAASYFSFLPSADREALLSKGDLEVTGARQSELRLSAKAPFAAELGAELVPGSTVALEGLFLFPRPAGNVELGIYNAVNAIASMEGLEYYSLSKKAYDKLILASYRVQSTDHPDKLPDPTFAAVPPYQKAVIFQKDNRLGDGLSEVVWKQTPQGLVMTLGNLQPLKYGLLTLVDPGNLKMLFVVTVLADKVAVYGVMEAKTASLFGLERSKDENFRNRMRALASWLGQRIAAVK